MSRNTAKSTISELEFQLEQLRQEKTALQGELETLQENSSELQIQVSFKNDQITFFKSIDVWGTVGNILLKIYSKIFSNVHLNETIL